MLISAAKSICFSPSSRSQLLLEHAAAALPGPAARSTPFDPVAARKSRLFAPLHDSLCGCCCSQGKGRRRRERATSWWALFENVEEDGNEDMSEAKKVLISTV